MSGVLRILLPALFLTVAHGAELPCSSAQNHRIQTGPGPLTQKLHAEADSLHILFKNGEFHEEKFSYIGAVKAQRGPTWHVALVFTVSGQSCRGTSRLLIFDEHLHFVGQYSHFNVRRFRVDGSSILIEDADQQSGNRIDFSESGPPPKAHFDGENFELDGAQ